MRRAGALLGALLVLALGVGSAQARVRHGAHRVAARVACPSGVPTQAITVLAEAHVRAWALRRVENALVAQSLQERAAWGTPCVVFAAGGWPLYLRVGVFESGLHTFPNGQPRLTVWTGGSQWQGWSVAFSHEIVEALADPGGGDQMYTPWNGLGVQMEIADPVEQAAYRLGRVYVSDFVLPSWYQGAMQQVTCDGSGCSYSDPVAATGSPYDEMRVTAASWQTDQGSM